MSQRISIVARTILLALALVVLAGRLPTPAARAQLAPFFVPGQVVVSGPQADVESVIQQLNGVNLRLEQVERLDLRYTAALPAGKTPFTPEQRRTLVSDLYQLRQAGDSVGLAIRDLNAVAAATGAVVLSDPNYLTGRPPLAQASNPWSVGGSPLPGDDGTPAPARFHEQWAFGFRGIRLYGRANGELVRRVPQTGAGVRVGVFDTSPFSSTTIVPPGSVLLDQRTVDWLSPTLNLRVGFTRFATTLQPDPTATDVSDHGLFVAGLIHAIAPASQIELVRVLDSSGQGDLYTLSRALHNFTRRRNIDSAQLAGAVINLSLGVHRPPAPEDYGLTPEIVARIFALETAIEAAEGFRISLVAAAGNDSQADAALPAQLPAAYPDVIAVAASDYLRGRSCFSNRGTLAAPGGGSADCLPELDACAGDCPAALIGPVMPANADASGYAYWSGTSFAAPLASGAAALLIDQADGGLPPPDLAARLYNGALRPALPPTDDSLGAGIISLPRSLYPYSTFVPLLLR